MMTIDHNVEQMMTATTGHEHACWEEFSERMVESSGLDIAGRHDDVIDGLTIWEHYTVAVLVEKRECYCDVQSDDEE